MTLFAYWTYISHIGLEYKCRKNVIQTPQFNEKCAYSLSNFLNDAGGGIITFNNDFMYMQSAYANSRAILSKHWE